MGGTVRDVRAITPVVGLYHAPHGTSSSRRMPNYRRYYPPLPVFVAVVTHARRPWLLAEVDLVLGAMRWVKAHLPYRHLAHVLLPDHLHWLFVPAEPRDLSRIVAAVKREASWRLKARVLRDRSGRTASTTT